MQSIILFLENINNTIRTNIYVGQEVLIIQKKDQRTGKTTRGIIKNILTSKSNHSRGIKVRLETGQVGRVSKII